MANAGPSTPGVEAVVDDTKEVVVIHLTRLHGSIILKCRFQRF